MCLIKMFSCTSVVPVFFSFVCMAGIYSNVQICEKVEVHGHEICTFVAVIYHASILSIPSMQTKTPDN